MIGIESTRWCEHGKRFDDYCGKCNTDTVKINGREIDVKLTYSQLKVLNFLAQNMNRLVSFADIENAFAPKSGSTHFHKWNHRIHITEIKKAIRPHGFDILSKSGFGYKIIDQVNPMNDPRDEFEIIYATLFRYPDSDDNPLDLDGRIEYAKSMRNDAGGYNFNSDLQGAFSVYLMAISKNKGE